jgi:hypothetical protein
MCYLNLGAEKHSFFIGHSMWGFILVVNFGFESSFDDGLHKLKCDSICKLMSPHSTLAEQLSSIKTFSSFQISSLS